jgi:hypothetical protein
MTNFKDSVESIINGLSDFWLQYFQEIDTLRTLYKGVEVEAGQVYLDLLSLLLNNSLQDTTVFSKEYFKLIRMKESEVLFREGVNTDANRFVFKAPDNIREADYLNNKVFNVEKSLSKNTDFTITNDEVLLNNDPTNAYREVTISSGTSAFRVRSLIAGKENLRVTISVTADPVIISVTETGGFTSINLVVTVGTSKISEVVQAINLHPHASKLVVAEALFNDGTQSTISSTGTFNLVKTSVSPLNGFATRNTEQQFGGKLTDLGVSDWIALGVEKGDYVRIFSGAGIASAQDFKITLVRKDALYVDQENPFPQDSAGKVDYTIIRKAEHLSSVREPIVNSGREINESNIDVDAITKTLTAPGAVFEPLLIGDLIELRGLLNIGYYRILDTPSTTEAVLAATVLQDESDIDIRIHTPITLMDTSSIINNGDSTATITATSSVFEEEHEGTVVRVVIAGTVHRYSVVEYLSGTEIKITADDNLPTTATVFRWGLCAEIPDEHTLVFSSPNFWNSRQVRVIARRELDGQEVQPGQDYAVSMLRGTITPRTVWQASVSNTATYDFDKTIVHNLTPVQSGANGTITSATPNTFSSPTANFNTSHVGYAIRIANSGLTGATTNGVHFIKAVVDANTVELTTDKVVPAVADPNNGSLEWELLRRGSVEVNSITTVTEIAFWAPDVKIDKFHLYNTYGYLINRFDRSSEKYRALIRGIFQLFMFGPTLERFESAINTVSGLPVVGQDGELLLRYENEADQEGTQGQFDFFTQAFSTTEYSFTSEDVGKFIYVKSGPNSNKLFRVSNVLDEHTIRYEGQAVTSSAVEWELTLLGNHKVVTDRREYSFPRNIPIKTKFTDADNFGILQLRAFEAITEVFTVTDHIESPQWFEFLQIPETLLPGEEVSRRQSSPALFENRVGPADDAHIGDPGFVIGGDSEGFVPPETAVRDDGGAADGELVGDIKYPFSNTEVFFESPTANFTALDLNAWVSTPEGSFRIVEIVSSDRVRIEAFKDVGDVSGLSWEISIRPLAKRHKAAFVVLNDYLKHHLFSVTFDTSITELLPTNLILDLQELVFVAKPAYTTLIVTPSTFFEELIFINEEDLSTGATYTLGGVSGETILGNTSPLMVIGESWRIGGWYREVSRSGAFGVTTTLLTALSPANFDPGHIGIVNRFVPTFANFNVGGVRAQVEDLVYTGIASFTGELAIVIDDGEVHVVAPANTFEDAHLLMYLNITSGDADNQGRFKIGRVIDSTTVVINNPDAVVESGLDGEIQSAGTVAGRFFTTSDGESRFIDLTGKHKFEASHVGTFIRKTFSTGLNELGQHYRIAERISDTEVRLAEARNVDPALRTPNKAFTKTGRIVTITNPGDIIFTPDMAKGGKKTYYFARRTSETAATNTTRFKITRFLSPNQVEVDVVSTTSGFGAVEVEEHYTFVNDTPEWEHTKLNYRVDKAQPWRILFDMPNRDFSTPFVAIGVQEPDDFSVAVMQPDEGDTPYSIGMVAPRHIRMRSRNARDMDLREEAINIRVITNDALQTEAEEDLLTEDEELLLVE